MAEADLLAGHYSVRRERDPPRRAERVHVVDRDSSRFLIGSAFGGEVVNRALPA